MFKATFRAVSSAIVTLAMASVALAAPVTINTDIDGNGVNEKQMSSLSRSFGGGAAGNATLLRKLTFSFALLTSETVNNDLFRITIKEDGLSDASHMTQFGGVVKTATPYNNTQPSIYREFDFATGAVSSPLPTGVPTLPNKLQISNASFAPIPGTLIVPVKPSPSFTYDAGATVGALGWYQVTVYVSQLSSIDIEFLVADSGNDGLDTILLVDNISLFGNSGGGNTYTTNDNNLLFDAGTLANWTVAGEAGIYTSIDHLGVDDNAIVKRTGDAYFAAIGTVNTNYVAPILPVPAPASMTLLLAGLPLLARRRRA